MPTRIVVLAALSAVLGWCATPARAQQAELNRDWTSTMLFEHRDDLNLKSAGVGLGDSAFLWTERENKALRASFRSRGGSLGPVQVLDPGPVETLALAGSFRGGAIALWYAWGPVNEIRMATLAPGARRFSAPQTIATSGYANPAVAMNERGDAVIAYASPEGITVNRRPAGGHVGSGSLISSESTWAPSLAVAPDGTALAGFQERDRLVIRISPPGGTFGPKHVLGRPRPELIPGIYLDMRARVRCSERCSLRLKGRIGRTALRTLASTAAARKERTLRLRVTKAMARRGVLRLDLRARDAAGNERRVKRTVRLRPAR